MIKLFGGFCAICMDFELPLQISNNFKFNIMITQQPRRKDYPTALELEVDQKLRLKQDEIERLKEENKQLKEQLKQNLK